MKELFPAEWLPISSTVIFFLGGSNFAPTDSATEINPEEKKERNLSTGALVLVCLFKKKQTKKNKQRVHLLHLSHYGAEIPVRKTVKSKTNT